MTAESRTRAPRRQHERRELTRAALVNATIESIAAHGYQATTTRVVAQLAGVSNGALAHHFPTRLDLVVGAMDAVGERFVREIGEQVDALLAARRRSTAAVLDVLWAAFGTDLFLAWVRVWLAAAEDPDLYTALADLEPRMSAAIATTLAEVAPPGQSAKTWSRRVGVALHALRGLALDQALQPRVRRPGADPWPAVRAELVALVDRPAT